MNLGYMDDILKLAVSLVSILNPIGVIPIFISLTESFSEEKVKRISSSCGITVSITLMISLLIGQRLLDFFSISLASFSIGGGILIFTMGMQMISAQTTTSKMSEEEAENINPSEIGIVPLAIPLLAGPGSISTAIIYSNKINQTIHWVAAMGVLILAGILIKVILHYSRAIGKKLGTLGLNVMTRVMGLIILSISIELVANGVKIILPGLN